MDSSLTYLTIRNISFYNNGISAICALILSLFIFVTCLLKYKATDRLSYKLYFWIALSDLLYNIDVFTKYYLLIIVNNDIEEYEFMRKKKNFAYCTLTSHFDLTINLWFVLLTTCLAFNLQQVFLRKKVLITSNHWVYAMGTLAVSLALNLPSVIFAFTKNQCFGLRAYIIRPYNFIYFYTVFGMPIIVSSIYCTYIFILTFITLRRTRAYHNHASAHIDLLARRLIGYAAIPLITQFPYVVASFFFIDPNFLDSPARAFFVEVLGSSAGWLNLVCFVFDPAIPQIWEEFKSRKSGGDILKKEEDPEEATKMKSILGVYWLASLKSNQFSFNMSSSCESDNFEQYKDDLMVKQM